MLTLPTRLAALACAASFATFAMAQSPGASPAAMAPETVLADNGLARVTRADYDLELTRLPDRIRGGFATSEKRIVDLINRILVTKSLAVMAESSGVLKDPEIARRYAAETERLRSQVMLAKIERDAAEDFDANVKPFEARARELFLADPRKYEVGSEVSASHILFATPAHTVEEARRLAGETRAAILAGADFETLARERSEDPSAKANGGKLGYIKRGQMDGEFEAAAFALTKVGEISMPIVSSFGVHLIRLDGRKEGQRPTFEQAKPRIMAEQRQKHINALKEAVTDQLRADAHKGTDMAKVGSMVIRVDSSQIDRLQREAVQRQQDALKGLTRPSPK